MHRLLALIMRGRVHAMTASAVFAVLSLLVPPLSYLSGAIIGLATLKQGPREGAMVIGGSVVLAGLFSIMLVGDASPTGAFIVMSWLPAWILAWMLGRWKQQGLVVVGAAVMGMLAVIGLHMMLTDTSAWWLELLRAMLQPALSEGAPNRENLDLLLQQWGPFMTRFFGAATTSGMLLTILLARYWHSILDNPGGFGTEFRALKIDQGTLLIALLIMVGGMFWSDMVGVVISDLMGPVVAALVFLGLAVSHGLVKVRKLGRGWLVVLYVLLLVPPHPAVSGLSMLGLLDGWLNFRARVKPAA